MKPIARIPPSPSGSGTRTTQLLSPARQRQSPSRHPSEFMQRSPQSPQWSASLLTSVQRQERWEPLWWRQARSPEGQAHRLSTQPEDSEGHARPQPAQFMRSLPVSAQTSPQRIVLPWVQVQTPFRHEAFEGHCTHMRPQASRSDRTSVQIVMERPARGVQSCTRPGMSPSGGVTVHSHPPFRQIVPRPHSVGPSSTRPSQLSSAPLQSSRAREFTARSASLQSAPPHVREGSPSPSPSSSRYTHTREATSHRPSTVHGSMSTQSPSAAQAWPMMQPRVS